MSIGDTAKALRSSAAIIAVIAGASALTACSSAGSAFFRDSTVTGSTSVNGVGNANQPMPSIIGGQRVAGGPYVPPNDIGGATTAGYAANATISTSGVKSGDLPVLNPSTTGNTAMPAPSLAPVSVGPQGAAQVTAAAPSSPSLAVVPQNAYVHVVASGESLYTIARRYNVGPQQIVQANGFAAPDRIFVGQKLIIPGQSAQMPTNSSTPVAAPQPATTRVANVAPQAQTPAPALVKPQTQPAPAQQAVAAPPAQQQPAPTAQPVPQQAAAPAAPVAQQPAQQVANTGEPKMSGAEKFRWPASGKVIVDFSASKGTGINIELPEGAAVRAVENGTVIYVGSGVEGYGNLVLIRHANGYVSAYAHLKAMTVAKGDVVNRGDNIGQAGMTGSVNRPQLHFELRKGATPVDPLPLLAG